MTITTEDRDMLLGAMDSLAMALAQRAHVYTVGEREIYEQAVAILETEEE